MTEDEFRALRHLHNVIAHRGDPNWPINFEQLKTHISEILKNLLHQKDFKILQNNESSFKSIVKVILVNLENQKLKSLQFDNILKNPMPFFNAHPIQHQASSNAIAVDPAVKVQQYETHQADEVKYNEEDEHQLQEEEGSDNEGPIDPKPTPTHEEKPANWGEESDDAQDENAQEEPAVDDYQEPIPQDDHPSTNIPRETYHSSNNYKPRGGFRGNNRGNWRGGRGNYHHNKDGGNYYPRDNYQGY